jgi:hypothetical protein
LTDPTDEERRAKKYIALAMVDKSTTDETVMSLVECGTKGLQLKRTIRFAALEGTATYSLRFDDVYLRKNPRRDCLKDCLASRRRSKGNLDAGGLSWLTKRLVLTRTFPRASIGETF